MADDQLELLTPAVYEHAATAIRAVAIALLEPTTKNRAEVAPALKGYADAWIRLRRREDTPGVSAHTERLIARLGQLAAEAVDGSLIDPDGITPELREALDRLQSRHGDDPDTMGEAPEDGDDT